MSNPTGRAPCHFVTQYQSAGKAALVVHRIDRSNLPPAGSPAAEWLATVTPTITCYFANCGMKAQAARALARHLAREMAADGVTVLTCQRLNPRDRLGRFCQL